MSSQGALSGGGGATGMLLGNYRNNSKRRITQYKIMKEMELLGFNQLIIDDIEYFNGLSEIEISNK